MDFDHIAERQGWDHDTRLDVMRRFIGDVLHAEKHLGLFAQGIADEENFSTELRIGDIVSVLLPWSEVCEHLRVAGERRDVSITSGGAQILDVNGKPFSFPISMIEAGFNPVGRDQWVHPESVIFAVDCRHAFPGDSLPPDGDLPRVRSLNEARELLLNFAPPLSRTTEHVAYIYWADGRDGISYGEPYGVLEFNQRSEIIFREFG